MALSKGTIQSAEVTKETAFFSVIPLSNHRRLFEYEQTRLEDTCCENITTNANTNITKPVVIHSTDVAVRGRTRVLEGSNASELSAASAQIVMTAPFGQDESAERT